MVGAEARSQEHIWHFNLLITLKMTANLFIRNSTEILQKHIRNISLAFM